MPVPYRTTDRMVAMPCVTHPGNGHGQALSRRERNMAGLGRGLRTAIVVPSLVALGLFVIKQPQMAGYSVFGTFAHLVMVNYARNPRRRSLEAITLTLVGAILVVLGGLTSVNSGIAVTGAMIAGFLSKYPALAKGHFATVRNALLLAFMMAVAVPTSLHNLLPELAGWLLAGFVAQPVLRLLWIPIRPRQTNDQVPTAGETTDISPNWWKDASCIGFAMGLAIFAARALNLNHAFWVVLGVLPVLSATGRSPSRMFWKEQAGTFLGFLVAVALVICLGAHQSGYWFLLPCAVFFSAFASSAIGVVATQAGFTVFAVVLFCILTQPDKQVGILRVEDIGVGGMLSLLVATLQRFGQSKAELMATHFCG